MELDALSVHHEMGHAYVAAALDCPINFIVLGDENFVSPRACPVEDLLLTIAGPVADAYFQMWSQYAELPGAEKHDPQNFPVAGNNLEGIREHLAGEPGPKPKLGHTQVQCPFNDLKPIAFTSSPPRYCQAQVESRGWFLDHHTIHDLRQQVELTFCDAFERSLCFVREHWVAICESASSIIGKKPGSIGVREQNVEIHYVTREPSNHGHLKCRLLKDQRGHSWVDIPDREILEANSQNRAQIFAGIAKHLGVKQEGLPRETRKAIESLFNPEP